MKLLVQPQDSVTPLIRGIDSAKKSVEIVIFRVDRREIEQALHRAVSRGVFVHALIARTNRGGEENLRKLEMRLLDAGVTVARTSDDLPRYHDKYLIIDRTTLYLIAFNLTYLDIERSRSFGIVTKNSRMVQEAVRLFEADIKRQSYTPGLPSFIVSPVNARQQLSSFIRGAKRELLIYDPHISDRLMIRLLEERTRAGVRIQIIGRVTRMSAKLPVRKSLGFRLHTRTIIRDRSQAFIGSQSLRQVELDARREAGVIVRDSRVVARLVKIFEEDWATAQTQVLQKDEPVTVERAMKKIAKAITKDFPPITPVLREAMKEVIGNGDAVDIDPDEIEETVRDAVKEVVKGIVKDVVDDVDDDVVDINNNGNINHPSGTSGTTH